MTSSATTSTLRLGTRASTLAQAQSGQVAALLGRRHPGLHIEIVPVRTTGDRITDKALHEFGGKGLFTRELEQALLSREIDFAVHSMKDVPVTMPLVDQSNLEIAAVPVREDVRDVLVSSTARGVSDLPAGARVGTGSLRRRAQLLALRPDLRIENIRGNIDTRLGKQRDGEFDAVILALAGLKRGGLFDPATAHPIDIDQMLPAAAQGALALQCRRDDANTRSLLEVLNDPGSALCTRIERGVVQALSGDCHSPIGVLGTISSWPDGKLRLRAAVAARGGNLPVVRADAVAPVAQAGRALEEVIAQLRALGAFELLGTGHA